MPKHRLVQEERLSTDGQTTLRSVYTPGGTPVGTQGFLPTPEGQHRAWLYPPCPDEPPEGEVVKRRRDNSQSIKNARKKAKKEEKSGVPTRRSLASRASAVGLSEGGLFLGKSYGLGEERSRAQKTYSEAVRRAELTSPEKDARASERRASEQVMVRTSIHVRKSHRT